MLIAMSQVPPLGIAPVVGVAKMPSMGVGLSICSRVGVWEELEGRIGVFCYEMIIGLNASKLK